MSRSLRAMAAIAALASAIAACSGTGDSGTTAPEPTPSTTSIAPVDGTTSTALETTTTATPAVAIDAIVITCEPGTGPNFAGQELAAIEFSGDTLRCGTFDDATLTRPTFATTDATGASFRGAQIDQGRFDQATLIGADFSGAELTQARFRNSDLSGADLRTAEIVNARWDNTVCPDGVNSDEVGATCEGHLEPLPVGVDATDAAVAVAPIEFTPLCAPDSGQDFSGQDLVAPDFRREDLRCARFDAATISDADFTSVDASGAVFDGAELSQAMFERTSLFGASFADAVINRGQFRNANLIGADITTTEFVDTRWGNTICPNGVNSDDAGGTCLGSRSALDLPVVAFDEITDGGITVREGSGLTTYTIATDLLFDFNSDTLTAPAQAALRQVVASIASRFGVDDEIQVWGHADAIGEPGYNLDLSQRRADNVAALLGDAEPLAGFRIVAVGLGEAQPIAPNANPDGSDDPEGRALNRRVEIVVRTG